MHRHQREASALLWIVREHRDWRALGSELMIVVKRPWGAGQELRHVAVALDQQLL